MGPNWATAARSLRDTGILLKNYLGPKLSLRAKRSNLPAYRGSPYGDCFGAPLLALTASFPSGHSSRSPNLLLWDRIFGVAQRCPAQAELADIAEHIIPRRHCSVLDPGDQIVEGEF